MEAEEEEMLGEGWEGRETRDPKWLDWIKMAGVKKHLSIYTHSPISLVVTGLISLP